MNNVILHDVRAAFFFDDGSYHAGDDLCCCGIGDRNASGPMGRPTICPVLRP
jgi:hypothetical protein